MRLREAITVLILILTMISCGTGSKPEETGIVGKIKLKDMNEKPVDLEQYRGKTVFINVWATWCKPCIQEMPSIAQAQSMLRDRNIEFLFASDEAKERIEGFAAKRNLDIRYVMLENLEELQIMALPQTYIINSKGELAFSEAGYRKWDDPANIELLIKIIEGNN